MLVKLHAQREAHLHQYIFDLVERLAAEVFGLQHFVFALLDELANGLDVRVLQAVIGTHGKLKLFDGAVQVLEARIVSDVLRRFGGLYRLFEVDEDAHVVLHQLGGQADGVLRGDRAVGPHFDHQLFVVGHLAEAGGFDGVVDLAHRRVNAVDRDVTDGQVFVIVAVGGHVAAAVLDAHLDLEFAALADRRDVHALIEDSEVRVFLDLRRGDRTGLLDVDVNRLRQVGVELDGHLLQVEDDVRGILDHAGDRRKFVQHAFDLHGGDGRAFDRAEQRATQRVSYGRTPAALKRLCGKPPVLLSERFQLGRKTLWFLKTLPHRVPSFRPESPGLKPNTMPGAPGSLALAALLRILLRVQLDDELLVDRRRLHVIALRHSHDLGLELFALLFEPGHRVLALRDVARFEHHGVLVHFFLDSYFLAHADKVGRDVDLFSINADVAVQHELPRLRTRGRQTRAPHHVIQTALEHDDQVFAGRALGACSLLKIIAELPLQQPIRSLDLLLLAQLQAVSRDLRAPRLPVLPRHEVALLDRALLRKATQAFQKQLLPFPAAQAADCISVSCQLLFSLPKTLGTLWDRHSCLSEFVRRSEEDRQECLSYTRRRFGGRQPLCGIGVTSRITTM